MSEDVKTAVARRWQCEVDVLLRAGYRQYETEVIREFASAHFYRTLPKQEAPSCLNNLEKGLQLGACLYGAKGTPCCEHTAQGNVGVDVKFTVLTMEALTDDLLRQREQWLVRMWKQAWP